MQAILSAFEVFNGVMQALEEFLNTRQPDVLVPVSKTEQPARIYAMYLRRDAVRIEGRGYRLEGPVKAGPNYRVHVCGGLGRQRGGTDCCF